MSTPTLPGSGLHIRPARREDQRLIRRLVMGAGLDPSTLKWKNFLLAEMDDEVVGCGQLKPYRGGPELGSLVVRKAWRGQGIGGALIEALLTQESGMVYLICQEKLVTYYERFGFEVVTLAVLPPAVKVKMTAARVLGGLMGFRGEAMGHMGIRRDKLATHGDTKHGSTD